MRFDRYPNVAELTKWTPTGPGSAPAVGGPPPRVYQYDALGRRNREPYNKELYYDAFGKIIEEREPFEVTQYVWGATGGNHLILRDRDTDGERDTPAQSTLPAGIDQRIYAVADAAGNVTTITGWDGNPVERYLYTPEGKLEIRTGDMSTALTSSACGWGYTYRSGRRDGEHLYYVGGKVYDYRTAGTLEPEPYQVWGIKPSMTPPAMSWYGKETSVFWSTFASELGHSARVAGRGMWNGVKQLGFMAADIVNDAVYVATYDRARLLWGDDAGGFRLYRGSLSSWGQAYDTGQLSFWDNQAHYRLVGEMLANSVSLGIYDQVKASVQLATDRIGWDEWTERMAVGGAFQMAVAPGLRGAPRAALRPAYTTEVVLPARGWRGFGEINSFGRNATFVPGTTSRLTTTLTLSRVGARVGELSSTYGIGGAYPFGNLSYPPFWGTQGPMTVVRLEPGTIVSRIGRPNSPFVSPAGTPLHLRGLPPGHPGTPETLYTVQQPVYVIQGHIAPWNSSPGGGIQWILPDDVSNLVGGVLR